VKAFRSSFRPSDSSQLEHLKLIQEVFGSFESIGDWLPSLDAALHCAILTQNMISEQEWTEIRVMICLVKCSRNNSFPLVFMPTCKSGENTERMKFCSASFLKPVLLKYSSQSWLSCDI
jgi:hypothetical protein